MRILGDLNFDNIGRLVQVSLGTETESTFPPSGSIVPGRLAFFDRRVWIAAEIVSGIAAWIPMTQEINAYIHTQGDATNTWVVNHNLNTGTPAVQVYNTSDQMVIPTDITTISANQLEIEFNAPVIGRAIVLSGTFEGNSRQGRVYGFVHDQPASSTTWVVGHGLGYYPIVTAFTATGEELVPQSVVHNSHFQTTITFSSPVSGIARFV